MQDLPEAEVWSLCDESHVALLPWAEAGYACCAVDLSGTSSSISGVRHVRADVRELCSLPGARFVMAWPPCTQFAISGARWWAKKPPHLLVEAVEVLGACVGLSEGLPLVLENPVGRIHQFWRDPDLYVHPWEFANWAKQPEQDAYTKKTGLWLESGAQAPIKNAWAGEVDRKRIHHSPDSRDRARRRSQTPEGLARAIFLSNRHLLAK